MSFVLQGEQATWLHGSCSVLHRTNPVLQGQNRLLINSGIP